MTVTFWEAAVQAVAAGQRVWLVTVAAVQGSAPQRPGAMMAVGPAGRLAGTIGGGALEYDCVQKVIRGQAVPGLRHLTLNENDPQGVGMVCGGSTDLLFTPLTDPRPLQAALERLRQHGDGLFCLPLDGGAPRLAAQDGGGQSGQLELPLLDPGRVFVIGGGHVAREVARLLEQLNYRYLVADDRPDYADPACFPAAEGVVCTGFDALAAAFPGEKAPGAGDAVCIMTRGHAGDGAAVRWALGTGAGYIGLMGSRRKREKLFAELAAEGYDDAPRRLVTPIGLAIGAVTPAEIAVSVCAQLIGWRHGAL